ncbi:MAG: ribosome-associated translation inhibitor RaiA [Flavobacteriales bacterium]|nr:ribosome-associated translation inhibitor RaiA [Flavobacteriales bacterium]
MKVQIHSIHFDADKALLAFIESKLQKLTVFNDTIISSEVFLRVEKRDRKENKLVEIKLHIPGKELFAKRNSISFEAAADEVVEALRRQIAKAQA